MRDIADFDRQHAQALEGIWFLGDVHGEFAHVDRVLQSTEKTPNWLVFLGDVDINHRPFREVLAPLKQDFPSVNVAFAYSGDRDR